MNDKKWKTVNSKAVINNLKLVFKTKDIGKLNKQTYNFLYLMSGFIAHYDINGFKAHYEDLRNLIGDLKNSSDVRNAERYVDDSFFQKDEISKDYYKSKTETLIQIPQIINEFEDEINNAFGQIERNNDINTIKILMAKNNLTKEVLA